MSRKRQTPVIPNVELAPGQRARTQEEKDKREGERILRNRRSAAVSRAKKERVVAELIARLRQEVAFNANLVTRLRHALRTVSTNLTEFEEILTAEFKFLADETSSALNTRRTPDNGLLSSSEEAPAHYMAGFHFNDTPPAPASYPVNLGPSWRGMGAQPSQASFLPDVRDQFPGSGYVPAAGNHSQINDDRTDSFSSFVSSSTDNTGLSSNTSGHFPYIAPVPPGVLSYTEHADPILGPTCEENAAWERRCLEHQQSLSTSALHAPPAGAAHQNFGHGQHMANLSFLPGPTASNGVASYTERFIPAIWNNDLTQVGAWQLNVGQVVPGNQLPSYDDSQLDESVFNYDDFFNYDPTQ
jgi:hypothetical protein